MERLNEVICHELSDKNRSIAEQLGNLCVWGHIQIWESFAISMFVFFNEKYVPNCWKFRHHFFLVHSRRSKPAPFFDAVSESARWVAATFVAAADGADDTELFGGLYDWLPKFSLFSLASASSLSKAAVWHCSTVDTNNLQNWQQQESNSKTMIHEPRFAVTNRDTNAYILMLGNFKKWDEMLHKHTRGKHCTRFLLMFWIKWYNKIRLLTLLRVNRFKNPMEAGIIMMEDWKFKRSKVLSKT